MAEETGTLLNGAINDGVGDGLGLGQAVCDYLAAHRAAARRRQPAGLGRPPRACR